MMKNYTVPKVTEIKMSCSHYKNQVRIKTNCCQKVFSCKICHDNSSDHKVKSSDITRIICNRCDTEQGVSNFCVNCNKDFGSLYCDKCKIWDYTDLEVFHCDKCNICRVGDKSKYFHCDNCDIGMSICLKDNHKCMNMRNINVLYVWGHI